MKKLNYYAMLRQLGIEEKDALSMAYQSSKESRDESSEFTKASDAIVGFAGWDQTVEGFEYWVALHDAVWGSRKKRSRKKQST